MENPLEWCDAAPGVWKHTTDSPAFDFASAEPKADALSDLPNVDFPLPSEDIYIETEQQGTTIRLPLNGVMIVSRIPNLL